MREMDDHLLKRLKRLEELVIGRGKNLSFCKWRYLDSERNNLLSAKQFYFLFLSKKDFL